MAPPESAHSLLSASGTVAPPNINLLAEVKDKQKLEKLNKRMSGAFAQIGKRQINVKAVSKRGTRSRSSLPANQGKIYSIAITSYLFY